LAEELDSLVEDAAEIIDELGLSDWTFTDEGGVGDPTTGTVAETPVSYTNIPASPPLSRTMATAFLEKYNKEHTDTSSMSVVILPAQRANGTSVGFTPTIGFRAVHSGVTWRVMEIETLQPSSRVAGWILLVRK